MRASKESEDFTEDSLQVGLLAESRTAQPPALLAENRRESLLPPSPPLAENRKDKEHL